MTTPAIDGSSLCLRCGLCCRGVLHDHLVVPASEVSRVRSLGLTVQPGPDGKQVVPLPCLRLAEDNRCGVYESRPSSCGAYRCRVLASYEQGQRTLEESLAVVSRARRMFESLNRSVPRRREGTVWQRLEHHLSSGQASVDVQAEATRLLVWTRKHFKGRERASGGV